MDYESNTHWRKSFFTLLLALGIPLSPMSWSPCSPVGVVGGQSIKRSPETEPAASPEGSERNAVAGRAGMENSSLRHCLGFPAGLFLVHIGLRYKGLEAEAHADK